MVLTAGEALSHVSTATPQTLGFLLMAVAGLIISIVILQSRSFGRSAALGKAAGYVGIIGFVVALGAYSSWLLGLTFAPMFIPINGLLWVVWWLMMSVGLFRLAKT